MDRRRREWGDRRQLTVLFCDVVESAQLLQILNDEDWSYVLREYHASCQEVIGLYEGHVAQYLGDGLLAYFGYPMAHENNGQRAVKAALDIIAQIGPMNARVHEAIAPRQATLRLRIAIHTGLVVVDELGKSAAERLALGIVPTIASRLQQEAEENSVVISDATYQLVRGAFNCRHLGTFQLKGITAAQSAYRVLSESELQGQFDTEVSTGLTPFVGREHEFERLANAWDKAVAGTGQVVLVEGDPGIGKSRLVREFTQGLQSREARRLFCRCTPYNRSSAYFPVIQIVHALLGVSGSDPDQLKLERIERAMLSVGSETADSVPLVARLLSLPLIEPDPRPHVSAAQERQKLQELIVHWLGSEAQKRPILLFIEDLHWIDPSSQEVLELLVSVIAGCRILLLASFRPEVPPPWHGSSHVQRMVLGPLSRSSAETMVRNLQGQRILHDEVIRRLIANTDGVPLFLEESALMLLRHEADATAIPASLHDLLMARLDRVGPAKELAQLAATIGADFSYEVLRLICPFDATTMQSHIERLLAAGLIYRSGDSADTAYSFKHALVRDTAYHSLLLRARRAIHERIATVFSKQFPEIARHQPELVAHHYTEAGAAQEAADHWQKAGRRSAERYELPEAIRHLRRGLDVLASMPSSERRQRQELDLLTALAGRLVATAGYGDAGVEKVYARALELATELNDTARRLQVMLGLQSFHFVRSSFPTAHRLAQECLELSRQLADPARELIVHWVLGEIFFHQGDHTLCEAHLSECMNNYRRSYHRPRTLQDPAVMSWSYCSWTHWKLGYPQRALKTVSQAISLAEDLDHPFSKSIAYSFAAGLHLFRGEIEATCVHADRAIELCSRHGFPVWLAFCTVVRGSARVRQGSISAGIEEIERGISMWESSGSVVTMPYCLTNLSEALAMDSRPALGLTRLAEAQAIVDRTGERYYEAEVFRMRGELLLKTHGDNHARAEAEACFTRAIAIAIQQRARSLELRATTSLTRLQRTSIPEAQVRKRLGAIYQWFTEGIDTADLTEARQLLGELRG